MTEREMEIIAATTRAGLARLREYNGAQDNAAEHALDVADAWLRGFLTGHNEIASLPQQS